MPTENELVRKPWRERLVALFEWNIALTIVGAAVATFSLLTHFFGPAPEPRIQLPVAAFESAISALQQSRSLVQDAIPRLSAEADEKTKASLADAVAMLSQAETSLKQNSKPWQSSSAVPSLISEAFAANDPTVDQAEFNRPLILYCILAAMGVLVLIFLGIYMFTKDPERLKFAQSNLQTIISFMIGVAAGMLGTTGHT